jgi:hypothetical protein
MENKTKKYQNKFIFEYLKNILVTKSFDIFKKHVEDKDSFKSFPAMVILRYLSMCNDVNVRNCVLKNQVLIERLYKDFPESFYRWCIISIPKQNSSFIKYLKG